MTAGELLSTLRSRGFEVQAGDGRLRVRPADAITPDLLDALRARKQELIDLLTRAQHESLVQEAAATFPGSRIVDEERWQTLLSLAARTWPQEPQEVALWQASAALAEVVTHLHELGDLVGEARARYAWERIQALDTRTP